MAKRRRIRRRGSLGSLLLKLLVLVALVAGIGAFWAKYQVEEGVRERLDQWAVQLRPFGELRYIGVSAGFDGVVTVTSLAFYPSRDLNMPPLISERAAVRFDDFFAMLGIGRSDPPESMTVRMEGVRMDFTVGARNVSGNPYEALACAAGEAFSPEELEAMGIYSPDASLEIGYELRVAQEQVMLHVGQWTGDLARIELRVDLNVPGLAGVLRQRGGDLPVATASIAGWRLELDATRFNQQRNSYCSDQLGVSVEEAVERNAEAALEALAAEGWQPASGLVDHYGAYLLGQGPWILAARPQPPLPLLESGGMAVDAVLSRMNVQSSIGSQATVAVELVAVETEAEVEPDDQTESARPARPPARWVVVAVDELPAHLQKNVQITTQQRQRYHGRLLEVTEDEVRIRTRLPGGDATVPIARNKITEVQVYTRPPAG